MNMNTYKYFSTTDLFLATVVSLFFPVDSVDKTNPRKTVFYFKREIALDEIVENYWARRLQIEPQALLTQLKSIKTRLYESE
jgi:hypothetical protein